MGVCTPGPQCWGHRDPGSGSNATYYDATCTPTGDGYVPGCGEYPAAADRGPIVTTTPVVQAPITIIPPAPGSVQRADIGWECWDACRNGVNATYYDADRRALRDGFVATCPACATAPPSAPTCPALVPGQSYRPTNSQARYVFLAGLLHLIPDPDTAAARGWTGWVDADPTCFTPGLIGDPIPTVRSTTPGSGTSPGGSGPDLGACVTMTTTCPTGQKVGVDAKGCPACVPSTGGSGFDLAAIWAQYKTPILVGGGALLALQSGLLSSLGGSSRRRR